PDSLRLRVKVAGVPNGTYTIRVQGNGPNGTPVHERFININVGFVGIVNNSIPEFFNLYQNYPNPFNPVTRIQYAVPKEGNVKLIVYDMLGKEISTLVNQRSQPGRYEVEFDASNLASGVYFYKIEAEAFTDIKKMILLK